MARIGVVGHKGYDKKQTPLFFWIGRALARLGHELVSIQETGLVRQIKEGYRIEGLEPITISEHLVENCDQTLAFVNDSLERSLSSRYDDIEGRTDIVLIRASQYDELREAILDIMTERGITPP